MEADGESKDAGDTTVFRGKMAPKLKRTCLSAKSALSGKPNVEEVPLGAKLPMIPGSRLQLYTSRLGEKLLQPSCDFDRTYPSDVYISNEYRCLHDPHLRHYFLNRPDMTKRLRKRSFITNENKVVCSLNEYNLYRQYLKHLSIEYFNKIYREKYEKELQQKREANKNVIEQKKKDPNNPITKRIEWAKTARCEMERIRYIKRRKI
uniref:Fibrous sheath-interacting protein 2 n=1 Tax=Ciona savignyi TaxID=51511 RepID=H2YC52_CIOSA